MRTVLAVSALLVLAATTAPLRSPAPALDVRVSVVPTIYSDFQLLKRATPDTYACSVAATDPETHHGASAELVATPGVPAKVVRKNGDYEVQFDVDIAKASEVAETRVTVRHGSMVVTRQRSVVRLLKASDKGYRPAQ